MCQPYIESATALSDSLYTSLAVDSSLKSSPIIAASTSTAGVSSCGGLSSSAGLLLSLSFLLLWLSSTSLCFLHFQKISILFIEKVL